MAHYPHGRVLAIIGSGETSPTMVTVHREFVTRLGLSSPRAILLATPYAFQENAADVSARAERYFADSVGLRVRVVAGTSPHADPGMAPPLTGADEDEVRQAAEITAADLVFSGPGSPSYALAGLDLLGALGVTAAVIPHYDNAEGGRYDTRYCYLGERRLAVMERDLPHDAAVLGVDEHTAVLIDLRTEDIEIRGRGGMTVRRSGEGVVLPSGTRLSLAGLRDLVRGIRLAGGGADGRRLGRPGDGPDHGDAAGGSNRIRDGEGAREGDGAGDGAREGDGDGDGDLVARPLAEIAAAAERRFAAAAGDRDADAMIEVVLELETAVNQWEADTDEDQGIEQARALLRSLIGRLGRAAGDGLAGPGDRLAPAVEPLLALRATLRGAGYYAAADAIRDALASAGLDVSDTPEGPRWQPTGTA